MNLPLHPKAKELFNTGLYSGLSSFEELEKRIAAFDDDNLKGDSFEVFAEAYLATQRKHDAARVWPLSAVPIEILRRLCLSEQDYGVDGLFQTLLDHINAYQVKFRSGRPSLTWRETSTFIGLADSPHIRSRILITNCDDLPAVLNERQGFFCIRGSDLDRLEAEDFRAIEAWLAESAFELPKKKPQPHQVEALSALVPALREHNRVSAIMACGTGKTLVAFWTAEKLQATRILVLLPSLALLRQTLHEWLHETSLTTLTYLCVCSDPTVKEGVDTLATNQSELDFEVSTDVNNVREFLDTPFAGTKVVFSTYQSAHIIGRAMKPDEIFDLGIFDEAHKTAGREGRNFGFALDDANLPIRKRLFITATPRHYNPHKRDQEGEAQVVFSMDNSEIYGPQAHKLTFGEAARRDIICNYKVIISVITSEMVTNEVLNRGEVIVNGDLVRARQVANQIALRDAVEKYGVRKIFTFHKTVQSAASFVAEGSEGVRMHLPDFKSYHVNGEMPTVRRERVMREFREATKAVMSNARCLTEGVDVPAVDMVAFLSPRRSRVDIVQATGRAMRRSPGKSVGYILVPLYVEIAAGESVQDAVSRADFDEVWDVLQSLQEQDDVLAELIRYVGEQKGRGEGFDDQRFADRIDFGGSQLSLENLRRAVTTRCLENLYSSWDGWLGRLKAFKERFGHCNVESGWEEDPALARWVTAQRSARNKGVLSDERITRLNELGFVWDWQAARTDENWANWYEKLRKFKERFGHCNVETGWEEDTSLASWASTQRVRRKKGILEKERIQRLDELGFIWDFQRQKAQETWMKWYRELENYVREHGNSHVPRTYSNKKLASWVWIQRQRRQGTYKGSEPITQEQISLLDKLSFGWDAREEQWVEKFENLKEFKAKYGHCEVGLIENEDNDLFYWVRVQRSKLSQGELKPERKALLDAIGFNWSAEILDHKWREMYEKLKQYHANNGNADVPHRWKNDLQLAAWVSHQRNRYKKRTLSNEQKQLLDDLGFSWKMRERGKWEDNLEMIAAFKEKHGHCDIPLQYPENPKLGRFINQTRVQRNSGRLSRDRIEKLDALGFIWSSTKYQVDENGVTQVWKTRFEELLHYKQVHGNCNVPHRWPENESLGNWVRQQRQLKKEGKLSADRIRLLEEINFAWDAGRSIETWEVRYTELLKFKAHYGNCDVPSVYTDNPKLGRWVDKQRQKKKQGKLSPEQEDLLNQAGFIWEKRAGRLR